MLVNTSFDRISSSCANDLRFHCCAFCLQIVRYSASLFFGKFGIVCFVVDPVGWPTTCSDCQGGAIAKSADDFLVDALFGSIAEHRFEGGFVPNESLGAPENDGETQRFAAAFDEAGAILDGAEGVGWGVDEAMAGAVAFCTGGASGPSQPSMASLGSQSPDLQHKPNWLRNTLPRASCA